MSFKSVDRTLADSEGVFQTVGPATKNVGWPNVTLLVGGVMENGAADESGRRD